MSEKNKNVLLYYRVSTQEQVDDGFSIPNQKRSLNKYCEAMEYTVLGEFEDLGITGTSIEEREGLKNLLKEIEKNSNIDTVIVSKLSRLSRKMLDLLQILQFLEKYDVTLIAKDDGIDTSSAFGKPMLTLIGVFAEMERDTIVSQTRSGMKEKAMQGGFNGGTPSIGYDYINKELVINENEATTVRKIFDLYTNKNWGYSRICQELNRNIEKYPTKKGATWAYATIKQVLDNPVYIGMMRWGVRKDWAKKRRKGTTDDYVLEKGKQKAIISEELWQKTRQKRELVGKTPEKKNNFKYLLSGLARCPVCGSAMVAQRSTRKNKDGSKVTYRYYSCSRWNSHKGDVCKPNSIKAELLEEQVINNLKEFIHSPSVVDKLVKDFGNKNNSIEIENNIENISKRIKRLKADEDKYYKYLVNDEMLKTFKESKLKELVDNINKESEELEQELNNYKIKLENIKKNNINAEKVAFMLKNFDKIFEKADFEKKKELLHTIIKEIIISPCGNIEGRKAKEIVLWFNGEDIMVYNKKDKKDNSLLFTCDTVHHSLS